MNFLFPSVTHSIAWPPYIELSPIRIEVYFFQLSRDRHDGIVLMYSNVLQN